MSKLDDLLKQYCPDGVEYKKIKDVYTRLKGSPVTAGIMKLIENPAGDIRIFAGGKTAVNAMREDIPNANIISVPAVLVQSRGVIDFVYYDKPFTFKNEMWAYTSKDVTSVKFLYYVLKNNTDFFQSRASVTGSLPQISLPVTEDFLIPVPPIPIQKEIVHILDAFTKLTAEFTAELTARRTQYEYYRDKLLSFDDETAIVKRIKDMLEQTCGGPENVENLPIGQLCNVSRGKVISKEYILEHTGKYPVFSSQTEDNGCLGEIDSFDYEGQFVTWTTDGANAGTVFYRDGKFNITNVCGLLSPKDTSLIEPKYLFYCLQIKAKNYVSKGMGNPKLMSNVMEKIPIPVPPIEIQQEIVSVLDKFNALATNIISGLPAEISLRQKQYEHYRDRLLNFNGGGGV